MNINQIPIIAIDGTASSGKGTIAYKLSQYLGFNYLNSGALYRLVAYEAMTQGVELDDTLGIIEIAKNIKPKRKPAPLIPPRRICWVFPYKRKSPRRSFWRTLLRAYWEGRQ